MCICGATYPSGAAEWDDRSKWEQRRWLREIGLGLVLLAVVLNIAMLAYLGFHRHPFVVEAILVIMFLPCCLILVLSLALVAEVFGIAASIWRTRITAKISRKRLP